MNTANMPKGGFQKGVKGTREGPQDFDFEILHVKADRLESINIKVSFALTSLPRRMRVRVTSQTHSGVLNRI